MRNCGVDGQGILIKLKLVSATKPDQLLGAAADAVEQAAWNMFTAGRTLTMNHQNRFVQAGDRLSLIHI